MTAEEKNPGARLTKQKVWEDRLAKNLEAVFQRLAIKDNPALQADMKDIAAGYLDLLLERRKTKKIIEPIKKDPSLENRLQHEHWSRIEAHVTDWNIESLKKIRAHTDSLDAYLPHLLKNRKWFTGAEYLKHLAGLVPGEDKMRDEMAERILGSVISCVLYAIDPKKDKRKPVKFDGDDFVRIPYVVERFDSADGVSFITQAQKEILEFLKSQELLAKLSTQVFSRKGIADQPEFHAVLGDIACEYLHKLINEPPSKAGEQPYIDLNNASVKKILKYPLILDTYIKDTLNPEKERKFIIDDGPPPEGLDMPAFSNAITREVLAKHLLNPRTSEGRLEAAKALLGSIIVRARTTSGSQEHVPYNLGGVSQLLK